MVVVVVVMVVVVVVSGLVGVTSSCFFASSFVSVAFSRTRCQEGASCERNDHCIPTAVLLSWGHDLGVHPAGMPYKHAVGFAAQQQTNNKKKKAGVVRRKSIFSDLSALIRKHPTHRYQQPKINKMLIFTKMQRF